MCDFGIRCFFEYKMNDGDFDYEESSIIIIANLSFNKFKLVQVLYKNSSKCAIAKWSNS